MARISRAKKIEWLKRYLPAEILGTILAVIVASITYAQSGSYVAAAAAGWFAEGIGFYGYFISLELLTNAAVYRHLRPFKRIVLATTVASTNLLVEFLPAELLDNFIIRPYLMYLIPQYVHPYWLGFLVGKLSADVIFYALAIVGYESRKRWLHR